MKKLGIIAIISILVLVVSSSGCTSTGNQTSSQGYQSDIKVGAATYDYFSQDGSASGGCAVENDGKIAYKQVKINLKIYDENGNVVGDETRTVGQIRPGEVINYFVVTEKAIPKGKSASATVINATPVT